MAAAEQFGDATERGRADFFLWGEEHGGIDVALNGDVGTGEAAEFRKGDAPIDAEDVGAGFDHRREKVVRSLGVINDGNGVAEAGDHFLDGRENKFGVILKIEFAAPGIKELDSGHTGANLPLEIGNGGLGDAV